MTGWTIRCRGIDWECPTEQDALGVLAYLRDFGRQPMGPITVDPAASEEMKALLALFPSQSQQQILL